MGYVTKTTTEYAGELSQSEILHFETYEDFVKYEESKNQFVESSDDIYPRLTEEQAYKLRILLGHVLGDKDCSELNEQLDCLYDNELECEDYDKMFFTFMQGDERVVLEDGEKEATIQFKQEKQNA